MKITTSTAQKMKSSANVFSLDFFSKCVPADLVTFTKKILDGRLHFLCSVGQFFQQNMLSFLSETIIISCDDSKTLCSFYGRQSISSQRMFTATVFHSELYEKKTLQKLQALKWAQVH